MSPVALRILMPTIALAFATAVARAEDGPLRGEVVARLSVTVTPDESGTLLVPSPFAILPEGNRVAIHVPESGGVFLLEGARILQHFPLPPNVEALQDLFATDRYLVAGRRPETGRETCHLDIFDLMTGAEPERIASANPYLRCSGEGAEQWRVVADDGGVGVYHPGTGSTVPLWRPGKGLLPGSVQLEAQRSGIGLIDGPAWLPNPDGSVSRKERGRTRAVTGADDGWFLDGLEGGDLFLLEPTDVADLPGEEGILLPPVLRVRHWQEEVAITEVGLRAVSSRVGADRLVFRGRPVRVQNGRLYWIYVSYDYLEIRSLAIPDGDFTGDIRPPLDPDESGAP